MSNPGPENIQQQVGQLTYALITRQDPDINKDSYLWTIQQALMKPDTVTKIKKARLLAGGWESWAQVECAIALKDVLPAASVVVREEPIYNGSIDRVDLWASGGGVPAAAVEMKCRNVNFGSELAQTGLPGQMIDDMVKIKNPIKAGYDTNRVLYAIGITGNPYDLVWQRKDQTNTIAESMWSAKDKNFQPVLKWCYLQAAQSVQVDLQDLKNVGSAWTNLYMVWYKLP